jgi:hypothetical protein
MGNTTVREVLVNAGKGKAKRQKGGGAKKIGRSKLKTGRREKNKARNIAKDLKLKAKKRLKKVGKTLL